jgi:hypothetical protein
MEIGIKSKRGPGIQIIPLSAPGDTRAKGKKSRWGLAIPVPLGLEPFPGSRIKTDRAGRFPSVMHLHKGGFIESWKALE